MSCPTSPSKLATHVTACHVKNIMSLAAYYYMSLATPCHCMSSITCMKEHMHFKIKQFTNSFFGYMHDEHHTWACAMYLYNTFTCHSPEPRAIHVDDGVQQAMMKPIRLHESLVSLLYIFELKGMLAYCS